jgi:hypothetical protein
MGQGIAFQHQPAGFHDSSSTTTPGYDFVARPKNVKPPANPTFAGVPVGEQRKPLAQAFVPERAPGLSRLAKAVVAVLLVAVTGLLAVFVGGFGLKAYRDHVRASEIQHTSVAFPTTIGGLTKRATAAGAASVDQLVSAVPTPALPKGATYAAKGRLGVVFASAFAMTDAGQRDYLGSARESASALGFTLVQVDAGRLGGQLWCGASVHKAQTFCAFADVASFGALIVPGVGAQGQTLAGAFRAAVELRS